MEANPERIGLHELGESSARLAKVFGSGVLPVFVATCAAEAVLLLALPGAVGDAAAAMFADPSWGMLDLPMNAGWIGLAVLLMAFIELVRMGLYSPLRRVVLDDVALTPREAFGDAARRILPIFLVQQLIGLVVMGASLIFALIGLQVMVIPYAIVTFILSPAIYLVAAHDRGILNAVSDAVTITRRNLVAVFGIQGALLVFAVWLSGFLQYAGAWSSTAALAAAWAVVGVVLTYRFAHFWAMSTLYLALDAEGHCR